MMLKVSFAIFLSTPSARRATRCRPGSAAPAPYFYPRPPRGGRRHSPLPFLFYFSISIHALREEGDARKSWQNGLGSAFLSTPSARRATQHRAGMAIHLQISIHALREEGDHDGRWLTLEDLSFLSTPSARRATESPRISGQCCHISIHALREEGDAHRAVQSSRQRYFYPRPPRGGRRHGQWL